MKRNNEELQVHIGETIDDMGGRFTDAWHRAESGRSIRRGARPVTR